MFVSKLYKETDFVYEIPETLVIYKVFYYYTTTYVCTNKNIGMENILLKNSVP
jgi:hypothetical protein